MNIPALFISSDGRVRPTWRAILFAPVFGAFFLVSSIAIAAPLAAGGVLRQENFELAFLLGGVAAALSAMATAAALLPLADKRSFRALGLWFYDGWGREFALGFVGGCGLVSVVAGLLALTGQVEFRLLALDPLSALRGVGWTLLFLLPPAAAEELVFRGYSFQRLVEAWGAFWAVLLFSAGFGLVHLRNPSATLLSTANTILVGVLLALTYLKTRGLWLPLGLHWSWNFSMGFVYSLPVSGLKLSSKLFSVEIGRPEWLSGGDYGPEGSILTTVVSLTACLWLARTRRLGISPAMAKELELQLGEGKNEAPC